MSEQLLKTLGIDGDRPGAYGRDTYEPTGSNWLTARSPIDNRDLARVGVATEDQYEQVLSDAQAVFAEWRMVPAPKRGELVRQIGERLRGYRDELGELISLEMGKIRAEGIGEVQEVIDMADFAVGLSRQLYGLTMHSERPLHRMYEQWHPLGIVGVITAFNFPMAVWGWNSMLAAVCGNSVLWKPSEHTPLCALAITKICQEAANDYGYPGLFGLIVGDGPKLGQRMAADRRIPLVSATGSCRMGCSVGEVVGGRLGRSILELGGNNAVIVTGDADLDLVVRSVVFGAVGTAGQRCTTTRRVLIDRSIEPELTKRLVEAYSQVKIGDPLKEGTLMGPLVHAQAVAAYEKALTVIKEQGGEILCGGKVLSGMPSDLYVEPTIVKAKREMEIIQEETFAPILYLISVGDLDEALEIHNSVPQGLSSAIFTQSVKAAERFLSHVGSDCGIANVNLGTSGAEIGGAFGGEKDTGGGREAGSDAWKAYMRRQTNTINWGDELPLAQGISFG